MSLINLLTCIANIIFETPFTRIHIIVSLLKIVTTYLGSYSDKLYVVYYL